MKKKYLFFILIPIGIIINIMMIILIIFSCSYYQIRKEEEFYKSANWCIEKEDFYTTYFPIIEKYVYNSFESKITIDDYDSYVNESHDYYRISIINSKYTIDIKITYYKEIAYVFDFESIYFYEYEKGFNYYDIEELDDILNDFINKFLKYEPTNNIISCLFREDENYKNTFIYYDSLIGNLGLGYSLNNKSRYFSFYLTLLMKNSDMLLNDIQID